MSQTLQHASLFASMTAAETVALARAAARRVAGLGVPAARGARLRARADELLADVGLGERAGVLVPSLSHGERKQLEVALALACRPQLLLLDEPAAGMSPAERARLVELLRSAAAEITLLFVEHDLDLVFELADRVTVLHLGELLLSGHPGRGAGQRRGPGGLPRARPAARSCSCRERARELTVGPAVPRTRPTSGSGRCVSFLQVRELVSGYDRSTVLNGVDLDLDRGAVLGLLGRNGVGKSTLVMTLMGLVPPTSGSVQLDGVELAGQPPDQIARAGVALVPQGRRVWATLTVAEHLALVAGPVGRGVDRVGWRGPSTPCSTCCPGWPSAGATTPASSPAASSRCWPSPGRC